MHKQKTLQEHYEFVEQMSRISFFMAFEWQKRLPELSLEEIIRRHTPLFFHALDLEPRASVPQFTVLPADTAIHFEEAMWQQIKKLAMDRAARYFRSSIGIASPELFNAGTLNYDAPLEVLPKNHCNFHIANAIAPRSILDEPEYLAGCLLTLLEKSSAEYGYDTLRTVTWLNDSERFLVFFPPEWRANRKICSYYNDKPDIPGWDFGFWGQLVTARGTFNQKAGAYLREHHVMRYKTYYSYCSFQSLKEYLKGKNYVA